jgi:1-acyl-sn-glycerol-3-phosphate acyltransferase
MSPSTAGAERRLLAALIRAWCTPFQSVSVPEVENVVFVANHASHLDAPAILAGLPARHRGRVAIAAAEDYFYCHRMRRWLVSLGLGTFPFPRQGRLGLQRAQVRLAAGSSVLLFPEGTRSPDGHQQPFRHGVGHLLLESGVPAVPVAVVGAHALWPRGQRLPRRGPLTVRFGQPWTPRPGQSAAEIAGELHARVAALGAATPAQCLR